MVERQEVEALLMERSIPVPESGCWIWIAACNSHGYGHFRRNGRHVKAHRKSLEIKLGRELPQSKFVCHACDTPQCINPDHLFLGTHTENMKDMDAKGRRVTPPQHGVNNGNARLTESDVRKILSDRRVYAEIAADYGVSRVTISKIKTGRSWSKFTGITPGQRVRIVPVEGGE